MSPGILGKKIGMTQVFRPDGQVVPVTLLKAGPCMVVQRKTPDHGRLRRRAARPGRVHQAAAHQQADGRPLEEGRRRGREVHARVSAAAGRRRLEGRRPGAGGSVQAQRKGGRDRRQQGTRLCGRREAPPFPRRRRHRTVRCSTARRARSAHPASRRACFRACAWADTWATTR